jgi:predicted permease
LTKALLMCLHLLTRSRANEPPNETHWTIVKVQLTKVLIFALVLGSFFAFGGFERPRLARDDYRSSARFARAWIVTVALFVVGGVLTVWGNEIADMIDWDIPTGLYPVLGVLLLLAGFFWMLMLRDARTPKTAQETTRQSAPGLPCIRGVLAFCGRMNQL